MKQNIHSRLFTFLVVGLLLVLTACPNGGKDPDPENNTSRITRAWKVQEVTATSGGTTTTLYKEGAAGNSENYAAYRLNFTSGNKFSRTEKDGTTNTEGGWSFNTDESQLTFDLGNPRTVRIMSLSNSELVYSYTETSAKGVSRDITFRMAAL